MPTRLLPFFVLLLPTLSIACLTPKPAGDADDTGDTDSEDTDDTNTGPGATIFEIRNGEIGVGQSVTIHGAIVTSPPTDDAEGFFIQDPAGGAKSGLYVWGPSQVPDVYVQPGDEVSVTGTVNDFYGWTEFTINDVAAVQKTGTGTIPAPADLGDGEGVNWDDYESVPVTLTNQTIESVNEFGTALLSGGINLDDGFEFRAEYSCRGTFESITGIVFYSYEEWSVNPREVADAGRFVAGEVLDTTVKGVQEDGVCGPVRLTDVVVTSDDWSDDDGGYFFVQDAGGGEYSGIAVFLKDDEYDATIGDTVAIEGTVNEFFGFTELDVADPADVSVTGTGEPVVTELAQAPADWEPYEGCLVMVSDVTATSDEEYGEVTTDWGASIDDLFYDFEGEDGATWSSVTGLIYYSYSTWKIEPRSAADLVE